MRSKINFTLQPKTPLQQGSWNAETMDLYEEALNVTPRVAEGDWLQRKRVKKKERESVGVLYFWLWKQKWL